jgi:hypothetical protein
VHETRTIAEWALGPDLNYILETVKDHARRFILDSRPPKVIEVQWHEAAPA